MNETSNNPATLGSVEEMVSVSLGNVRQDLRHRYEECQNQVRKSPTTAILGAVGIGYLLHRLPVRSILITQVRVISALTPPFLILYGATKIISYLQKQELDKQHPDHKRDAPIER